MNMRTLEARLSSLADGELHEQIRMLSNMSRHASRVLAAAHRARKRNIRARQQAGA